MKKVVLNLPWRDLEDGVRVILFQDDTIIQRPFKEFMSSMPAFRITFNPRPDTFKWAVDLALAFSDGRTSFGDTGRAVVSEIGIRPTGDYDWPSGHFDVLDNQHRPYTVRWRPDYRPELADIADVVRHLQSHIRDIMQDWARSEAFRKTRTAMEKKKP